MPTAESLNETPLIVSERKTNYLRDGRAAIKLRDKQFLDIEPTRIPGTPLSELIIRERRGE